MEIKTEATLLTAESKPFDFDGRSGVSHRIRLNVGGEIYVCKSDESQVLSLKQHIGRNGNAVVKVNSRKEALSLELKSFTPSK